jgi:hypothetical protein
VFSYNSAKDGVSVPKGYFCYNTIKVDEKYNPIYYWNTTESGKTEKEKAEEKP